MGCGGNATHVFSSKDVERAFGTEGLVLHPLPSNGAEQPAMGETSPCATRFAATTSRGSLIVSVCENRRAAESVPSGQPFRRTRDNVLVEYSGSDAPTRARIGHALAALD
jgi:hypothetical protein